MKGFLTRLDGLWKRGLSSATSVCVVGAYCILLPVLCRAQSATLYTITTVAGNGTTGFSGDGGAATSAQLAGPSNVAVDRSLNLFIADQVNNRVREVTVNGSISTVAGKGGATGYAGDGGQATSAQLHTPYGITVDTSGNFYFTDYFNSVVRKVGSSGVITTVAGNGSNNYNGDGGAAITAALNRPLGVTIDAAGNLYIADTGNNVIRKVNTQGIISTVAGTGYPSYAGDGGPATSAFLNAPSSVAVDAGGNIYIADTGNHAVRKVTTDGNISTVAGNGTSGFSGDYGPATSAQLYHPLSVAMDPSGNLFIADTFNSRIRKMDTNGVITTVAGNGVFGYSGDGGLAGNAALFFPSGLAPDASGNIYVADTQNNVIRKLTPVPPPVAGGPPAIDPNGVISAQAFGGFYSVAPGSWIEIHGSNLAGNSRSWTIADFQGSNAPTSLDGTTVTIDGQGAFLSYISPNQVNALVPSNVRAGIRQLTVTTAAGTSDSYTLTVGETQPGLFAPATFNIGGKQYVAAVFPDFQAFVLPPDAIPGVPSREAKPGETIVVFGIGFGPVTPDIPAGELVQQLNTVNSPLQFSIANQLAIIEYAGLVPTQTGLYQFNLVVPDVAAGDLLPFSFTLDLVGSEQTLYTAVQNP